MSIFLSYEWILKSSVNIGTIKYTSKEYTWWEKRGEANRVVRIAERPSQIWLNKFLDLGLFAWNPLQRTGVDRQGSLKGAV